MKTIKVLKDIYEKRPILFPEYFHRGPSLYKVAVAKKKLGTGDYRLGKEHEGEYVCAGIERKSSPTELYACFLGADRERCRDQLRRMRQTYTHPYLLIDHTPGELYTYHWRAIDNDATDWTGELVLQQIVDACVEFGVSLVWAQRADNGPRQAMLGSIVLALLTPQKRLENTEKLLDSHQIGAII